MRSGCAGVLTLVPVTGIPLGWALLSACSLAAAVAVATAAALPLFLVGCATAVCSMHNQWLSAPENSTSTFHLHKFVSIKGSPRKLGPRRTAAGRASAMQPRCLVQTTGAAAASSHRAGGSSAGAGLALGAAMQQAPPLLQRSGAELAPVPEAEQAAQQSG